MAPKSKKTKAIVETDTKQKQLENKNTPSFREKVATINILEISPEAKYKVGDKLLKKLIEKEKLTSEENKEFCEIALSINTTSHHRLLIETMS